MTTILGDEMDATDDCSKLMETMRCLERETAILEQDVLKCCGATFAQCNAILGIGDRETSLNDLAEVLELDKSTASRTVDGLAKAGLVERNVDPGDRRYVRISLTWKGRDAKSEITTGMAGYYRRLYLAIPPGKRKLVQQGLEALIEALGDVRGGSGEYA
ncbi:MAG TPA: MarR family transcriptional regulator [Methanocella sp.]|nr:MarR family transcriptional regulator [Methanocella sp.]